MKVAIVGFGFNAEKAHVPVYRDRSDIHLTAVVDPVTSRRAAALRQYADIRVYEQFSDLLEEYSSEIDVIDICLPSTFHLESIKQALAADKHVLCEKPLVLNKAEYYELVNIANERKRILYPCHNYKFAPSIVHAAYLINSGEIGIPLFASFNIFGVGFQPGVRGKDKELSGGGIMIDHGLDAISVAQTLFGGFPQRISAHTRSFNETNSQLEDVAVFCLDWENKLINISVSSLGSIPKAYYRIQGTEGEISIENNDVFLSVKDKPVQHIFVPTYFDDPGHTNWFNGLIENFLDCANNPETEPFSLMEAGLVLEIAEKASHSSNNGGSWMGIEFTTKSLQMVG
ncbi:MAG: Gfo/Idh/MocA family oxidoreductase [Okeania sp. SIO2C9]|uniref:Gfo/Idh/MocA family protein n=1 Tax=Okeania sp. SIO2C9 TaxID=2607791 RepID=UPI0013BF8FFE|nr:Gfo/Idh/MocA family oxidoreductase [Okeania sp. SIO2C9]NEQ75058.1 Gfo/Idh/MocA family oxidoreductase [Okeania sp. SIO2C9]